MTHGHCDSNFVERTNLLVLFFDGAQPLLVVADLIPRDALPSDEAEVCEQLEEEGQELVGRADEPASAASYRLVHRLAAQSELQDDDQNDTQADRKEESRQEDGHRARVEHPARPLLRIFAPVAWHHRVQVLDLSPKEAHLVPCPLDQKQSEPRIDQQQDDLPVRPFPHTCPLVYSTIIIR